MYNLFLYKYLYFYTHYAIMLLGSTLERIKSATGIPQLEAVQCRLAW